MCACTSPTKAPSPGCSSTSCDDDDARRRHADDVGPPVGAIVIAVADRRRRRAADPRRHGVADRRRLIGKQAAQPSRRRTLRCAAGRSNVSIAFDTDAPFEPAVLIDQRGRQDRHGDTLLFRQPAGVDAVEIGGGRRGATAYARRADGGARSGRGLTRNGDARPPRAGAARAATTDDRFEHGERRQRRRGRRRDRHLLRRTVDVLRKLGACDDVSSCWPIRVMAGTHTSTTTPSRTAARASTKLNRGSEGSSRRSSSTVTAAAERNQERAAKCAPVSRPRGHRRDGARRAPRR